MPIWIEAEDLAHCMREQTARPPHMCSSSEDDLLHQGLQQALHGQKLCIRYMGVQDLGRPVADTPMMSMAQTAHLAWPAADQRHHDKGS